MDKYLYTHTRMHTREHIHTCTCTHTCRPTCIHTYKQIHTRILICVYMHVSSYTLARIRLLHLYSMTKQTTCISLIFKLWPCNYSWSTHRILSLLLAASGESAFVDACVKCSEYLQVYSAFIYFNLIWLTANVVHFCFLGSHPHASYDIRERLPVAETWRRVWGDGKFFRRTQDF